MRQRVGTRLTPPVQLASRVGYFFLLIVNSSCLRTMKQVGFSMSVNRLSKLNLGCYNLFL